MNHNELISQARTLEQNGDFHRAFEIYKTGLERQPNARGLILGAGRTARRLKKDDVALAYFREARSLFPDDASIILQVFNLEINSDLEAALATATDGLLKFPDDAKISEAEAWVRLRLGDETVLDSFDLDREIENAAVGKAFLQDVLKQKQVQYTRAELTHFHRLIAENFPTQNHTLNYAESLLHCRDYEKAYAAFSQLPLTVSPARLNMGLAICNAALGQIGESEYYLERSIAMQTDPLSLLNSCAQFIDHAANESSATQVLKRLNVKYHDNGVDQLLVFLAAILPAQAARERHSLAGKRPRLAKHLSILGLVFSQ